MIFPASFKSWLEKQTWYLRLRYSAPVLQSWLRLRPSVKRELDTQRRMYLSLVNGVAGSSRLVFDIGANEGFITAMFAEAGYAVLAVEPSTRNLAILQQRFHNNKNVTCLGKAASDKTGHLDFFETGRQHALATASEKWKQQQPGLYTSAQRVVETVTIDQLMSQYGEPCFVKVDVEGHEEAVLQGLTAKLPLVSFEAILPLFINETENTIGHLNQLGPGSLFNYARNNNLQWDEFRPAEEMINMLHRLPPGTIEVFCKMLVSPSAT